MQTVEAFKDSDGGLHRTKKDAMASELQILVREHSEYELSARAAYVLVEKARSAVSILHNSDDFPQT